MRWGTLAVGLCLAASLARADLPINEQRAYKATLRTASGARTVEAVASFSPEGIGLLGYDPAHKQWVSLSVPLFEEVRFEDGSVTFRFPGPPGKPPLTLRLTQVQMSIEVWVKEPAACGPEARLQLAQPAKLQLQCPSVTDFEESTEGYQKYRRAVRKSPRCWFLQEPLERACMLFSAQRYYASPNRSARVQRLEEYLGVALPMEDVSVRLRYCNKVKDMDSRCRGVEPLKEAIESGPPELVSVLLREGANPKEPREPYSSEPKLLELAVQKKHRQAVEALLAAGVKPQPSDLKLALQQEEPVLTELLLKAGVPPDAGDFITVVKRGQEELARKLLALGAPPNGMDREGQTPLYTAASLGMTGLVRELLARGARVEDRSAPGMTPLMGAARQGHVEVVRLLLEHGADIQARDNSTCQQRAVDLAFSARKEEVVRVLEAAGSTQPKEGCQTP